MNTIARLFRSGAVWFSFVQLGVILALLLTALQPGFRGGGFIQAVLVLMVLFQTAALVMDSRGALSADASPPPPSIAGDDEEEETGVETGPFLLITSHLIFMLIATYLLGVYVGLFLFLFGYFRLTGGRRTGAALVLAGLFGVLLPFFFSYAVQVPLWTGVVPELIPGFIGGSISPPI